MKVKLLGPVDSQRANGLQPTRLLRPWDFPGKSTGEGCHCLLWLIQGLIINFGFSEMILISYCGKLSHNIINELEKSTLLSVSSVNKLSLRCAMEVLREVIENNKKYCHYF